jgi:hypothetical protein
MMKRTLTKDRNGFAPAAGLMMNPWVILILAIVIIVLAVMGGLAVLYAPNVAAAAVLLFIAVLFVWQVPVADMRIRIGVFLALLIAALLIYFYGTEFLAVIV